MLTLYAPFEVSVSGELTAAVLDVRRLVTTTSELPLALWVNPFVNVTVPVPGESAATNDWLGVKL
jgi:hypothetical protein